MSALGFLYSSKKKKGKKLDHGSKRDYQKRLRQYRELRSSFLAANLVFFFLFDEQQRPRYGKVSTNHE